MIHVKIATYDATKIRRRYKGSLATSSRFIKLWSVPRETHSIRGSLALSRQSFKSRTPCHQIYSDPVLQLKSWSGFGERDIQVLKDDERESNEGGRVIERERQRETETETKK